MKRQRIMTRGGRAVIWAPKKLLLFVALFVVMTVGGILTTRAYADTGETKVGERLVTLYDRGIERSFVTTASTVEGALKEADIEIDTRDRVEPDLSEELVADRYTINVYRARPLLVVDGMSRQVIMTASQVPSQIAEDAGIPLYDEDRAALEQSRNILTDRAAERFVITRATPVQLTLYGETLTVRTQAATVGGLLREKGITLGKNDRVSESAETTITADMKLRVWREGRQTITVDEQVPFETEEIKDANREAGYRKVRTAGVKGEASVTYQVTIRDGKEVARKKIASVTKKKAQKEVVVVGAKSFKPTGSKMTWLLASGIPEDQWQYVDYLVSRESGWNPCAYYPGQSNCDANPVNACGLVQQNPCHKIPGDWRDPVAALKWQYQYVQKFGGYAGAVEYWKRNGSY